MDGQPPPEEDFNQIPLLERVKHSNWKARLSAYNELIVTFQKSSSDDDPIFTPYLSNVDLLKRIVTDSNAAAQDKGLEALTELLKQSGTSSAHLSAELAKPIVDKGFAASRPSTKLKAIELCLQFVEVEGLSDTIINNVIETLNAKQPKLVATCITSLKEVVTQFGFKPISNPKPLLKSLTKIFGHSDKNVRSEGSLLAQSIYTYLGQSLFPFLDELKPVQVKELKESFEKLDSDGKGAGTGTPTRLTRAAQAEKDANEASGEEPQAEENNAEVDIGFDPTEDIPPIDIISTLNLEFYTLIESKKWQERKEVIDQLLETLTKSPKIMPDSNYSDLINALSKRISELNINVVIGAAQALQKLGQGLPSEKFAPFKNTISKPLFERLKERKPAVTDTLGGALDSMFNATGFSDFVDDVSTYSKHKNPQIKQGTLLFVVRCLKNTKVPPTTSEQKEIGSICVGAMEDSFEPVRAASAESLGTLMKIIGERAMNPILEGLDNPRKSKINEFYEKAEVKVKAGAFKPKVAPNQKSFAPPAKPAPAPAPTKKSEPIKTTLSQDNEESIAPKPASRAPPARLLSKKPIPTSTSAASKPQPVKKPIPVTTSKPSTGGIAPSEPPKFSFSSEDAEAKALEVIPPNIVSALGNSNWKDRLQGIEDFHKWAIDEDGQSQLHCEILFRFLSKSPGWNEKNFQVSSKQFTLLGALAEKSASFSRACASLAIGPLVEKLGDMKLKKPAGDSLIIFSEKTSHQFVLSQGYEPMMKVKAPKAQADTLLWVQQILIDFGISGLSLKDLIEFLKNGLKSANAAVRTNATKTLVTLKLFVGSDIRAFLEDLNPQLLSTIDSEFSKVDGQSAPEPIRTCADSSTVSSKGENSSSGGNTGGDSLDDLFPRQNLDKLVPSGVVASSKSDAWKTRKEALESLQNVLEVKANSRLLPNMGEIGQALKGRLNDQNKIVQGITLDIIQKIALGMNKPFEKHVRLFVQGVASITSDQKANVRTSAIATLDAMASSCEAIDLLVAPLAASLESTNPTLRSNVLEWINSFLQKTPPSSSTDLSPLASPVITCLEDRNGDVRKNAQALLPSIISNTSYDFVESKTDKLKPAAKNSILPVLQAARSQVPQSNNVANSTNTTAVPPPKPKIPSIRPPVSSTNNVPTPVKTAPAKFAPPPSPSIKPSVGNRSRFGALSRPTPTTSTSNEIPDDEGRFGIKAKVPLKKPSIASSIASTSSNNPIADEYPFISSDLMGKRQRAVKDGNRWVMNGDPARPEQIDHLEHQTQQFLSPHLHNLLFSTDHHAERDYLAGLSIIVDVLGDAIGDNEKYGLGVEKTRQNILANVDIILKYVTLRLFDNNTSILLKTLEVIELTLRVVDEVNAQLTDYEANAFLPTLIVKCGDSKEPVRVKIRGILKLLGRSYPPSKVFSQLLEHGTTCKNSRTRSESIEELGSIINRHGLGVCNSNRCLPAIATLLGDRDSSVRNSVLNTFVEVYKLIGEQVWSMVGSLGPKEKSMLEERLKRLPGKSSMTPAKPATSSRIAQPAGRPSSSLSKISQPVMRSESPMRPDSRSSSRASSRTIHRPQSPVTTTSITAAESPRIPKPGGIPVSKIGAPRSIRPPSSLGKPSSIQSTQLPSSSASAISRPNSLTSSRSGVSSSLSQLNNEPPTDPIAGILSNEPDRSVDSLKVIQRKLESPTDDLVRQADRLVTNITTQMFNTFEALREEMAPNMFRLAKHLIQTLNATVDSPTIAATLSSDSIRLLLEELTTRLLQTADSPTLKDLSRFINMLLLRLFTHGDLTAIFSALFDLLSAATINLHDLRIVNDSAEAKLPELVLKCVWKTARNVKDDLQAERLDASVLLYTLEQFLQKIPPAEWRARATDEIALGDMPLRTVKTIIQSLVAVYDDKVYEKLDLISNPEDSIVYTYLFRLLNRGAPASSNNHNGNDGYGLGIKNVPTVSKNSKIDMTQSSQEEYEVNERLRKIFDKISEASTNKEGIAELYVFQKEHPEKQGKIEKQLSDLGEVFNSYIKRVLGRFANEDAERASIASPSKESPALGHSSQHSESTAPPQSPGLRSSQSSHGEKRASLDEKNLNRISSLFGFKPQSLYTPETNNEAPTVFSQTEGYRSEQSQQWHNDENVQ